MDWLYSLDVEVFRLINSSLSNPVLDRTLPSFSWNPLFIPALLGLAGWLCWKGGTRGRVFVCLLLVVAVIGDGVFCDLLKKTIHRPRPFTVLLDAHLLVGKGSAGSMPSSHAANWAAASVLTAIYYPAALLWVVPIAVVVSLSRIYLGVHYPSDVVAGAALGIAYTFALVFLFERIWKWAGPRWFPSWWNRLPSLLLKEGPRTAEAESKGKPGRVPVQGTSAELQWLRFGYVLIGGLLLVRLVYLASGKIELSEDEAYQWQWSKHPALSYFSKPPLIAYAQFIGTHLWGDNEFGVRFLSPVIAAVLGVVLLRFLHREAGVRATLALLLMTMATPLLAVGATLMTIDALSVLFWTLAVVSAWTAIQRDSTGAWVWTGIWIGLGFLSKYTALFQWLSLAILFCVWPPARRQLRRPGPYLALAITLLSAVPVLAWNAQNGWITLTHLENRAGLDQTWRPTLRFFQDFVLAEFALLNPIFFCATALALWRGWRTRSIPDLSRYLFTMGLPVFVIYFFYTFRARVQPNWIAPSIVPLFAGAVVYWTQLCPPERLRAAKRWLIAGFVFGVIPIIFLHDTNLAAKIAGKPLPAAADPLTRVRGWKELARVVANEGETLARDGKPVFFIGGHYGVTSLLSFYLPNARSRVPNNPICYYLSSDHPENQYYFWPGYSTRKGQNAIFVQRPNQPAPERLQQEFETVTDLGTRDIQYRGRIIHRVQLFACRNLK
jgi:membrane-associated phospholipid phosphatase